MSATGTVSIKVQKNAVIGAEESGGFSFRGHVSEKDGIFTCLKVVEMKAKMRKSLSRMLSELHLRFGPCFNARAAVQCPSSHMDVMMNRLSSNAPRKIGDYEVTSVSTMDGIKFAMGNRKWFLIGPSGTEPLIRIYAESTDEKTLGQILREGKRLVTGGGE